jgi:hypothetical protein
MAANPTRIINFPSDKNGCGFYRTIIPLGYLTAKCEWDATFMYQFVFDLNLIRSASCVRFQRQCTEMQKRCILEYSRCIERTKSPAKIAYELDDLVHGIEPHNVLAYQFYTPVRRQNVVDIMKMSHIVTFSTQFLKDFYNDHFGITHSTVLPNFLPKFLWQPTFADKRPNKKKPVIMWAGSASHVGPGGDLEFLLPMIEATSDEFEWLFVGVVPPKLKNKVSHISWANFYEYPSMMQSIKADVAIAPISDTVFNYAKSDLKYLEYSAMNIPSLLSSIGNGLGPYNKTNGNLVTNDVDAWYQAIKELSTDEGKKMDTLKRQQEYLAGRWLENPENINLYKSIYAPGQ